MNFFGRLWKGNSLLPFVWRIGLIGWGLLLPLFVVEPSVGAQEPTPLSIREVIQDQDGDRVPNRLGQLATIEGVLTSEPRLTRRSTESVAYIQDQTAGIRLRVPDNSLIVQHLEPGDIVRVRGSVERDGRRLQFDVQEITKVGEGKIPIPQTVSVSDLRSGRYLGHLVRLKGRLNTPAKLVEYPPPITLADSSGEIFVYLSNRLLRDAEFTLRLSKGGKVEVVGIVQKSEAPPPNDSGYQIRPRSIADIQFPSAPPIKEVGLALVVGLALATVFYFWRRRRDAEKTVKELAALGENLRRSEEALRETNQRLEAVLASSPLAIVVRDLKGNVQTWNPAAEQMFGWRKEEVIGSPLPVVPEDEQELYQENIRRLSKGEVLLVEEVRPQRKDGSRFYASLAIAPLYDLDRRIKGFLAILQDTTEKKDWNARLLQMQKMEAIGQLAGGIAHDFNNSIGAILGWAEFALEEAGRNSAMTKPLNHIVDQARHATDLTRELATFARRQPLEPQNVDLNQVVEQTLQLAARTLPADIEVSKVLAAGLSAVRADPTQLERILMNLCLNARDAMPRGGKLCIGTEPVKVDEDYCRSFTNAKPGDYAVLWVTDTGVGMDAETQMRIFEPFFTTKADGKGTGLGLAVVYGIVKQHGGFINVYSEPGQGTTFRIYLPVSRELDRKPRPDTAETLVGGNEVILLAEDHAGYRGIAQHTLESLGYQVRTAADGKEALQVFQHYRAEIRLAILDVVMPGMRGPEAYKKMCVEQPNLPVIFVSGYSVEADSLITNPLRHVAFLQKPYNPKALARKVRELLDQHAGERTLA